MPATSIPVASDQQIFISGWKEIADYVDRGVRTVQRWEKELAFPVRRPGRKSRGAVIALRSDIDRWLKSSPLTNADNARLAQECDGNGVEALARLSGLVQESRLLRASLVRSRGELGAVVTLLIKSISEIKCNRSLRTAN